MAMEQLFPANRRGDPKNKQPDRNHAHGAVSGTGIAFGGNGMRGEKP